MGDITETEDKFLDELVRDCITYRLDQNEALEYIAIRFKQISLSTYKRRKSYVLSDQSTEVWLNNFTRIGFVKNHQQDIETISKIRDDSIHQLQLEISKGQLERNEKLILQLKNDIRLSTQLLSELNLGTPIISAIKAKLLKKKREQEDEQIEDNEYYTNQEYNQSSDNEQQRELISIQQPSESMNLQQTISNQVDSTALESNSIKDNSINDIVSNVLSSKANTLDCKIVSSDQVSNTSNQVDSSISDSNTSNSNDMDNS